MVVAVKFNAHDPKAYAYKYEGDVLLAKGDLVLVEVNRDYGLGVGCVHALNVNPPDRPLSNIIQKLVKP